MRYDQGRLVHRDFHLLERGEDDYRLAGLRAILRDIYPVPRDTFVTADLPVLLTILSLDRARSQSGEKD
jgi:hypothetical protein